MTPPNAKLPARRRLLPGLQIIGLTTAVSLAFAVAQAQLLVRICPDYFVRFHPARVAVENHTLLSLICGSTVGAAFGLLLGIGFALAARVGRRPVRDVPSMVRPLIFLVLTLTFTTLGAAVVGYRLGSTNTVQLDPRLLAELGSGPSAFIAVVFAQMASTFVACTAGGMHVALVWYSRRTRRR